MSISSRSIYEEIVEAIDEDISKSVRRNLLTMHRFVYASDILEILHIVSLSINIILAFVAERFNDVLLYSNIIACMALSFALLSKYCNKEARERNERLELLLKNFRQFEKRQPILGTTESNI
jgi:hypothetical protein